MNNAESQKSIVLKGQDAITEIVIVDPITLPIARFFAKKNVGPLTISLLAFAARILAGILLLRGALSYAAVSAIIGLFLDGIDGKIVRIRNMSDALYGSLDFVLDQIAFAFMGVAAITWGLHNSRPTEVILLGIWLGVYMLLMAFTSTWFRILSQHGIVSQDNTGTKVFNEIATGRKKGTFPFLVTILGTTFLKVRDKLKKYRITPYPTTIESELVLFMIAPFFNFHPIFIYLAIFFLLPDVIIRMILILIKIIYAGK